MNQSPQKQSIEDIIDHFEFQSVFDFEAEQHNNIDIFNGQQTNESNQILQNNVLTQKEPEIELFAEFQKVSPHFLETNSVFVYYTKLYYCTLQKRKFTYYNNKKRNHPLGILNFDQQKFIFTVVKQQKDELVQSFKFRPEGSNKIFEFVVPTKLMQTFTEQWLSRIQEYIMESQGLLQDLQTLAQYYRFWRHERIIHEEILAQAQTGDLIIFRSKGSLPNLQRSFTRSDFGILNIPIQISDHIVMFLRSPVTQELTLLESSNQYGVIAFSYTRFVKARSFRNFEKILFVPLMNLKVEERIQLYEKAQAQVGKGYSLSMMKLFTKSKRQNFFCSELIAFLYQSMGFIHKNEKCCTYFPGDFTHEKKQIKLENGVTLGKNYIVDFYYSLRQ